MHYANPSDSPNYRLCLVHVPPRDLLAVSPRQRLCAVGA